MLIYFFSTRSSKMNPQCIIVIPLPSINKVHSRRSLLNTNQSVPWLKVIVFAFLGKRSGFPAMHRLFFTVAEQRQNFIGLPCEEDIRQEYLHLIVCIKLNDAKSSISFSFSHLYFNRGALIIFSLLLKIYIT